MRYAVIALLWLSSLILASEIEEKARLFIEEHVRKIAPLGKTCNEAYWSATATGRDEFYQQAADLEIRIRKLYASKEDFETVKTLKAGDIQDPLLKRQIDLLYLAFLGNQIDPELLEQMVKKASAIEAKFNTHRGLFAGEKVADNTLEEVLRTETDCARRKEAWEASKTVGETVAADLIELVKLRNKAARQLGFKNYYEMSMVLSEQDPSEIARIFDELAEVTEEPFRDVKAIIDRGLAAKYQIPVEAMRPYHYEDFFFQEVPAIGEIDIDEYLQDRDIKKIAVEFYSEMGLDVGRILENSDLYERENKYQHAYCTDIDREGDVRIMTSLRNDRYWLVTLLHELGHGAYDLYIDGKLPWLLRECAHIFTTEAVAQMFEYLPGNPYWLHDVLDIPREKVREWEGQLQLEKRMNYLIFCRWSLVMLHFERDLYADPDQDLNELWWDYVEKYQMVKRVEGRNKPDWSAKIHLTSSPVYYHNYMLGNLLVSQLMHYMAKNVLDTDDVGKITFVRQPAAGKYLKEKIFAPGKKYRWDDLIIRATGEPLSAKYFARDVSR